MAQVYDMPRTLGTVRAKARNFSPDDVHLFRLLCGLKGKTPSQMFRALVRDAVRAEIGTSAQKHSSEAEALFSKLSKGQS